MPRIWLSILLALLNLSTSAQLPEGFGTEAVEEDLENIAGIRFLNDSSSLIWTFNGKVFLMSGGEVHDEPLIDIHTEVGQWGDHGALGFAIHPDFELNGYIYLLYQVDTYDLLNEDSVGFNPNAQLNYSASMARLSRFTLDTQYPHAYLEGSRSVLIGSARGNGIPQMSASHGIGSLEFGTDGSLLISAGDGSTWVGAFTGGPPYPEFAYDEDGLQWGILSPDQNIGSYRAQYLDSYSGKVLRIDPESGLGLPSNPYYDAEDPDSPRSKVWSLGLRNPFRMIVRPGTGSSLIEEGNPGSIYIGDVGYYTWEEINVANGPALNFGWPQYEGMETFIGYDTALTYHPHYSNPLFNPGSCAYAKYHFQDLLVQANESHNYSWGNPCDALVPLEDTLDLFAHERPVVAYTNQASSHEHDVLVPGYDANGEAIGVPALDLPTVNGEEFTGISSIAGDFYYGTSFPEEYFGAYFQSDYSGWMRVFWFDENDQLVDFQHFTSELGPIFGTRFNPYDECLYVTAGFPSTISRICYEGNLRPNALIAVDTLYGPSPLTVDFDGSASWDPDEDPISYHWDFGDGAESEQVMTSHTFSAPDEEPLAYEVILSVTDTAGNVDQESVIISLNNTPPQVDITSLMDSGLYSVQSVTTADLIAEVQDTEHSDDELSYYWQTILHHNTHFHANPYDNAHVTSTILEPAGCQDYATYYYQISLRVDDPAGLSGYDEVLLYPDCDSDTLPPVIGAFDEYLLYPNPNFGNFTLRGPLTEGEVYQVQIFDPAGRMHFDESRRVDEFGRLGIVVDRLPIGQYILQLIGVERSATLRLFIAAD